MIDVLGLFPGRRPRRLRRTAALRDLVRETRLAPQDLVAPYFVRADSGQRRAISSLPGQFQHSVDRLAETVGPAVEAGVRGVILFGVPEESGKSPDARGAFDPDGPVPRAVRELRETFPQLVVMTDVCLCAYTDHGHCGLIEGGEIANDASLGPLAEMALCHARAGAQVVAPSDMMDGRVGAIRARLDEAGFQETAILSYAVKYASAFYGPFREAAASAPSFGDRAGYQMDPANVREALVEIGQDVAEGADLVMVKPAGAYLDVIARAREAVPLPLAAYQVSGEYACLEAAAERGWIDRKRAVLETLGAIRRAGADLVLTYYAAEAARWIGENA